VNSVLLALFQTRPGASHRLVVVLVAVSEPLVPVLLPVAVVDAVPASVADPLAVAVCDAVAVAVAEWVSGTVSDALLVAVIKAVLVPELETLASRAASAATAGKRIGSSRFCGQLRSVGHERLVVLATARGQRKDES